MHTRNKNKRTSLMGCLPSVAPHPPYTTNPAVAASWMRIGDSIVQVLRRIKTTKQRDGDSRPSTKGEQLHVNWCNDVHGDLRRCGRATRI